MCGRYFFDLTNEVLAGILAQAQQAMPKAGIKGGEIFPSESAAVLTRAGIRAMRWGFVPPSGKGRVINAKSETALQRPMFSYAMRNNPCLVPASCYYEWQKQGKKGIKHAFYGQDMPAFYLAGCYEETKEGLPTFAILTRAASACVMPIHDRMPVIFDREAARRFLNGEPGALQGALTQLVIKRAAEDGEE